MAIPKPSIRSRLTRRRIILLLTPVVLFLFYVLFGFFGVPWLVRHTAMDRITQRLNGKASVDRVTFNPFTFEMNLDNMVIVDAAGKAVAGFGHVYADLQVSSLWHRAWVFREIVVNQPFGNVDIDEAGVLSLNKLIKPQPPREKPATPPALEIDRLAVIGAGFDYADRSLAEPFHHRADRIDFTLDHFKTRPDNQNPYTFTATTAAGEHIAWEGSFYLDPLTSDGRLTFEKIDVPTYFPYYSRFSNCRVVGGKLAVRLAYHFAPTRSPRAVSCDVESVELSDLSLRANGEQEPFFTLDRVALDGIDADAVARSLSVRKLSVTGGRLIAQRNADGRITVVDWLTPPPEGKQTTRPATTAPASRPPGITPGTAPAPGSLEAALAAIINDARRPWNVKIESIELADQQLAAQDHAAARPIALNVTQVAFTAGPIGSDENYAVPLKFSAHVGEKGSVAVDGKVEPFGPHLPGGPRGPGASGSIVADMHVAVTDLDLTPLDAYWTTYITAKLPSGRVSCDGRVTGTWDSMSKFTARFVGQGALSDIALIKQGETEPFASTGEMKATGLDADATLTGADLAYHIGVHELELTEPRVNVVLTHGPAAASPTSKASGGGGGGDSKGSGGVKPPLITNLDDIMSNPLPMPRGVHVDHVIVRGGVATLDDKTEPGTAKMLVESIDADAHGLSHKRDARVDFVIKGKMANDAPFHIEGSMLSHQPTSDTIVSLTMNYAPLPGFDAYGKRFLGYSIAKGKLNLAVKYTIKDHKLVGDNQIHLDAFYLGESYNSPDAVDLPFKLAFAMLRDRKEQIHLDIPLNGDLNDPKFSLSKIVWQAVGTTLEKIVAAPFDTLASLLGAKDVDLSQVRFDAGTANLAAGEAAKFNLLVQALAERPGLVLGLHGMVDPSSDGTALRRNHLKELILQKTSGASSGGAGGSGGDADTAAGSTATLKEVDYRDAVARLYQRVVKGEGSTEDAKAHGKPFHEIGDFFHSIFSDDKDQKKKASAEKSAEPGTPAPVTFEVMEAKVLETVSLKENELPDLAVQRAQAVRKALGGRLEPARLIDDKPPKDAKPVASVVFDLR